LLYNNFDKFKKCYLEHTRHCFIINFVWS